MNKKETGLITLEQAKKLLELPLGPGETVVGRLAVLQNLMYYDNECPECHRDCECE